LEKALRDAGEEGREAAANLAELVTTAAEFDDVGPDEDQPTLADYLAQVSLVSDLDHFNGAGGAVTLMTLHAAKGLEFPAVFVVGCEAGLLPFERAEETTASAAAAASKLEEERRLAFVGITRAQRELTLSAARYRMIRGRVTPQAASPFLSEIGAESVTTIDATTPQRVQATRPGGFAGGRSRHRGGYYEDADERRIIEAMAEAAEVPPEYEYLRVGSRVRHSKFGIGKVVQISQPWPQTRAKVEFNGLGTKTLVLQMAKLELL